MVLSVSVKFIWSPNKSTHRDLTKITPSGSIENVFILQTPKRDVIGYVEYKDMESAIQVSIFPVYGKLFD